ncbi:hypothetical protein LZP73_06300 [Shewanella sp. AS16]|uniref:hypothetical protein n=1 Tax=Shewanella sp. AS16 TaxID=2907625 RepID=UPI001F1A646D|nr:hypothetical protein [Shewanella sp. AS16]MCE9685828.1 hypothetical protein [Shewanella sp. AS16]
MTSHVDKNLPSVIRVHSATTYKHGVDACKEATNRLILPASRTCNIPKTIRQQLKAWYSHKPKNRKFSKNMLAKLSSYMRAMLENPCGYGCEPFIDMLYLTVDVDSSVSDGLGEAVTQYEGNQLKLKKSGQTWMLKNNKEVYLNFASFTNRENSVIRIYWGLHDKVKEYRPNQRLLKIAFNPARHTEHELIEFFQWIKSVIGKGAKALLKAANVTRIDIAMDLFGVPLRYLLIDRPNVKHINYHQNQAATGKLVGTQKFGNPESTCFHVYDKVQKYCDVGPGFVPLPGYNVEGTEYIPITRAEKVFRPADTVPVSLGNLEDVPYFLKGTRIYCPTLINLLTPGQKLKVKQYGFAYWFRELKKQRWAHKKQMSRHLLKEDRNTLHAVQITALKRLKRLILYS